MKKHWYTTLFGALAATGAALHNSGIAIGHIGPIDFTALAAALGIAGLGATAADASKTVSKDGQ